MKSMYLFIFREILYLYYKMSTTKKALLVGCNYSKDTTNRLYGCINDVTSMANTLVDAFDYDLNNIILLRDDSNSATVLPTRANILSRLQSLVTASPNLTEIWFHYSGHGSQVRDTNKDEIDNLDEVIVPTDFQTAGFITDDEIFTILQKVSTKCRVILLFDSCNSGSICDLANIFQVTGKTINKSASSNKSINHPNIFCFSGCKDNQTCADTYSNIEARSVGAFTNTFLHCLRTNHFNVDVFKLYGDICTVISKYGFTQTPVFSSSNTSPSLVLGRVSYCSTSTLSNPIAPFFTVPIGTGTNREIVDPILYLNNTSLKKRETQMKMVF